MHSLNRKLFPLINLVTVLLIVGVLYFAKEVLMPLALAALFAFMLNPLVTFLHRRKLPRGLAVVVVTAFVFVVLGLVGWVIGREFRSLAEELPSYKENITERVASFRNAGKGGVMDKLVDLKRTIVTSAQDDPNDPSPGGASEEKPVPVVVKESESSTPGGSAGGTFMDHAGGVLGTAATVLLFTIFMLLRQQELRNRVMRLAGFRHLTVATRAMDEVGDKVSRYLLMQGLINGIYGVLLGIGFYFIGLPYVVLWGVLAALFRFIPYVGPWIAAILPSALSLAVFDGWMQPLMVIGLITSLELFTNMILEPILYGQSTGVSDFALLVAIAFWTWLWGPIGLVMATPLTVCIVVLCKHVPSLESVEILMGDKPEMKPYMIFFQRLVAQDELEAEEFIARELKDKDTVTVVDETIMPAIALARREARAGRLTPAEQKRINDSADALLERVDAARGKELQKEADKLRAKEKKKEDADEAAGIEPEPEPEPLPAPPAGPLILGRALQEGGDDSALRLLDRLLGDTVNFETLSSARLSWEFLQEVEERKPRAVLLSATPPDSHDHAKANVKRLRARFPDLRILVGRWGVPNDIVNAEPLLEAGADAVYHRLADASLALSQLGFATPAPFPISPPSDSSGKDSGRNSARVFHGL